ARSDPLVPGVTVLPDAVVLGTGAGAGVVVTGGGAGVRTGGRYRGRVSRVGVVRRTGAGSAAGGVVGTSLSCGCTVVSRFASCRSRLSAVSCVRELSAAF